MTFAKGSKLETIELPDSCTSVEADAFQDCTSLRIIVARGIKTQGDFGSIHP